MNFNVISYMYVCIDRSDFRSILKMILLCEIFFFILSHWICLDVWKTAEGTARLQIKHKSRKIYASKYESKNQV